MKLNINMKSVTIGFISLISLVGVTTSSFASYQTCQIAKGRLKEAQAARKLVSDSMFFHSNKLYEINKNINKLLVEQKELLSNRVRTNGAVRNILAALVRRSALQNEMSQLLIQIEKVPATESITEQLNRISRIETDIAQIDRMIYRQRHNVQDVFSWFQGFTLIRLAIVNTSLFLQNGFKNYHQTELKALWKKYQVKNAAVSVALADKNRQCKYYE